MTTIRQERVAELLYQELSIMVGNELKDPNLSLATVTGVTISRDLRHAKVYVSHDDDEVTRGSLIQSLKRATPYLRRQIAVRCTLRFVPELLFYYDDTPEKAARVDELLQKIASERANGESDEDVSEAGSPTADKSTTPGQQVPGTGENG